MTQSTRDEYLTLRRRYEPEDIRLIVIAESPPASGRYFYNPDGAPTEPLFAALTGELGIPRTIKSEGLSKFQRCGWLLVDATYEPVNDGRPDSRRDAVIKRDYDLLRADLERLTPDHSTALVLIKANVCRILEPKLVRDGFNVLNRGVLVPFPASGQQPKFREQFGAVLKLAGMMTEPAS